jgi:hypothetical protein
VYKLEATHEKTPLNLGPAGLVVAADVSFSFSTRAARPARRSRSDDDGGGGAARGT